MTSAHFNTDERYTLWDISPSGTWLLDRTYYGAFFKDPAVIEWLNETLTNGWKRAVRPEGWAPSTS